MPGPMKTASWRGSNPASHSAFNNKRLQDAHRARGIYVYFAGELGAGRAIGYSRDLRQRAYAMLCDPSTLQGSPLPRQGGGLQSSVHQADDDMPDMALTRR